MDSIYQVTAQFDHGESISYLLVGNFSTPGLAHLYKDKWTQFFEEAKKLLDKPEDWDPTQDDWVKGDYEPQWSDSKAYYNLLAQYDYVNDFVEIHVNKLPSQGEVFMTSHNWSEPTAKLMTQFDRDWKLKQLQK